MKIIHLYSSGISNINGVTNVVERISSHQKELGHEVLAVNIKDKPSIRSILSFHPDIISFNGLYYLGFIKIALVLSKRHIPYIVVFHGSASKENLKKNTIKKRIANFLFFNQFVRNARKVVYLNQGELDNSFFRAINSSSIVIPNGVDIHPIQIFKRHEKINIMFFSRIDIYGKGLDVYAEVIKRIARSEIANDVLFTFYGHVYESSKSYFDQFDTKLVKYCGTVFGKEKSQAFEDADIVILPSRSEGMPLTILEAFSYGLPVIVTPETNMGEVVENNNVGWVSALTVEHLYETIVRAISDYNEDFEGYHVRSHRCSLDYSWERIARKSIEEYNIVLGS